jgi:hypothetical protein
VRSIPCIAPPLVTLSSRRTFASSSQASFNSCPGGLRKGRSLSTSDVRNRSCHGCHGGQRAFCDWRASGTPAADSDGSGSAGCKEDSPEEVPAGKEPPEGSGTSSDGPMSSHCEGGGLFPFFRVRVLFRRGFTPCCGIERCV